MNARPDSSTRAATPAIDRDFAQFLLRTFDDPNQYGVHQLFNDWWRYAPDSVKARYVADFESIPQQRQFLEAAYLPEPVPLDQLARCAEGTLGHTYWRFIVDNHLEKNIAVNYRKFHDHLVAQGALDGMPEQIRYAIIRGFQTYDLQHVVTGYDSSPRGEITLQAFCLAQIRFPYFAMWMSVVTTRMTFIDPDSIVPIMDSITAGWQLGRRVRNIQFGQWETRFDDQLTDIRREYGLAVEGQRPHSD